MCSLACHVRTESDRWTQCHNDNWAPSWKPCLVIWFHTEFDYSNCSPWCLSIVWHNWLTPAIETRAVSGAVACEIRKTWLIYGLMETLDCAYPDACIKWRNYGQPKTHVGSSSRHSWQWRVNIKARFRLPSINTCEYIYIGGRTIWDGGGHRAFLWWIFTGGQSIGYLQILFSNWF